jgi:hypothetical protein
VLLAEAEKGGSDLREGYTGFRVARCGQKGLGGCGIVERLDPLFVRTSSM